MPRKKRKSRPSSPKSRSAPKLPAEFQGPAFFDPRIMERAMRQSIPETLLGGHRDPDLAEAENLVFQAYETDDFQQRMRLASKALDICPDCAEAYVCLAELAGSPALAVELYRMGVQAGEQALGGEQGLGGYEGRFWSSLDTRPYMRARAGLAHCLWALGEREEALQHCRELLRMNPLDNQGIRYMLSAYYCDLGRDSELLDLLDRYPDDTRPQWAFTRALLAYRREGDTGSSRDLLQTAHQANPHTAGYLLGNRPLPARSPAFLQVGGETDAAAYAGEFLTSWRASPGALSWLRKTLRIEVAEAPPPRGPSLQHLVEGAAELPQNEGEIWQIDLRQTMIGAADEEDASGPAWILIITCPAADQVLRVKPCGTQKPHAREVLTRLLETMHDPRDGEPRRPGRIQVQRETYLTGWQRKLAALEIECELCSHLEHIQIVLGRAEEIGSFPDLTGADLQQRVDELADLSQDPGEVWQADVRQLATWVREQGVPQRPIGALVATCSGNLILAQRISLDESEPQLLWEAVLAALLAPAAGTPHLPGTIEVGRLEFGDLLRQHLRTLNVECLVRPELDRLDFIYGELQESLSASDAPALIDTPGVTPAHVQGLFDAAAHYYTSQPWRKAPRDVPIRIGCDRFQTSTWYGVVMGQSGITPGLALYEDLEVLRAILREDADVDRRHTGLSVMYGEPFEISIRDLGMAEKNGWPIAAPEAHPILLRINPGMAIRPPLAWEMELAEGCLRAIPAFVSRDAATPAKMVVPTAAGDLTLQLDWLDT